MVAACSSISSTYSRAALQLDSRALCGGPGFAAEDRNAAKKGKAPGSAGGFGTRGRGLGAGVNSFNCLNDER